MGYVVIEKTSGTFTITGETISGVDSQDSVACNFIKSQAYAPHHHIDDSDQAWVTDVLLEQLHILISIMSLL